MRRGLVYASILLLFAAAVVLRARRAERDASREIVSVYGEWRKHGKPVDVRRAVRGALLHVTKVSGVADGHGAVRAEVTPEMAGELRPGQSFDGCGAQPIRGSVESVSPRADLTTGLRGAVLKLREGGPIPRGTIVVACASSPGRSVLLLPRAAVADGSVVWVVRDSRAHPRKVVLGESDERSVEAVSGLAEGELVVVDGWRSLEEGDRVRIRREGGGRP